jgi:Uma2 family endonuclease
MVRAPRFATYEDILNAPPNMVAEIIAGQLRLQPRPGSPHFTAASNLGEELGPPFKRGRGGPGGWLIADEPELHLSGDVLVPDLAGWRRERLPRFEAEAFVTLPPDWVCEVLSQSTARTDRSEKLPIYAREKVQFVWLVDPLMRTLEAFKLASGLYALLGAWKDDARIRVEPFEAIELELGILWADVVLKDAPP